MRVRQELLRAARSKASVRWRLVLLMAIAGTFVVFFGCKRNYSKDDHSFWLSHSYLQEKPTCSQVGFFVAHAKFGLGLYLPWQAYPPWLPDVISIRQTGVLPWASFRFHLAMGTLAIG